MTSSQSPAHIPVEGVMRIFKRVNQWHGLSSRSIIVKMLTAMNVTVIENIAVFGFHLLL